MVLVLVSSLKRRLVSPQKQALKGKVLQQPQQQRGLSFTGNAAGMSEDSRSGRDWCFSSSGSRGRERVIAGERKVQGKKPSGTGSPLSRDAEGGSSLQSSAMGCGGLGSSRNQIGTTLNLMAPTNAGIASRPGVQTCPLGAMSPLQQHTVGGVSKQGGGRSKGTGGSSPGAAMLHQATQSSFSDRLTGSAGSLVGKAPLAQGLSLAGQSIPTSQGGQHPQSKINQRSAQGVLTGSSAASTAPVPNLEAVLAAAMANNSQSQQALRASSVSAAGNVGCTSRMGAPAVSLGSISMGISSKSLGPNQVKSSSSQKLPFPIPQKVGAGGAPMKRDSSPLSVGPVLSMLGPSFSAQSLSSKSSQQSQVQIQGLTQSSQQHIGSQSHGSAQGQGPPPQLQPQQSKHSLTNPHQTQQQHAVHPHMFH